MESENTLAKACSPKIQFYFLFDQEGVFEINKTVCISSISVNEPDAVRGRIISSRTIECVGHRFWLRGRRRIVVFDWFCKGKYSDSDQSILTGFVSVSAHACNQLIMRSA